ncbi:MAG: FAD-linked oxidase C-terminal domain-containing protein, partial [Acidimicrobiales bacterium]|nr:FAD-linked oxidase C-terminal domain-containing protein [Acidimicrobiales bacterium]
GHLGDGNVHVNILGPEGAEPNEGVDEAVLLYVAELGGSISAEHGIGSAKREFLHLNRSSSELAAFRAIKTALDPNGILNPNVLLPPESP